MLHEWWFDWQIDLWPVTMAGLVGVGCGLLGAVFLLRRSALLGDAVSHSVLPGIALGLVAFDAASSRGWVGEHGRSAFGLSWSLAFILAGALVAGLLSTSLIELLFRRSRIKPDTAIGAVFPAFFAAGIIIIELLATGAHFDAKCVFYGALEVVSSPEQVLPTLACTVATLILFSFAYKEILVSSFDASYARTIGVRTRLISSAIVALLTATVVCAFEAVGAVLVIAFLIVPPATAYLLTDRFHTLLALSAFFGLVSGVGGCWWTIALEKLGFETARAPTMALTSGALFVLAFLFAPRRGVVATLLARARLRWRILDENVLGALYRVAPAADDQASARVRPAAASAYLGSPPRLVARAIGRAMRRGEVIVHSDGTTSLTAIGRDRVEQLVRAHRLWESWMTSAMGAAADHVHSAADEMEHYLRPALVHELAGFLDEPSHDPHGAEIPPSPPPREPI